MEDDGESDKKVRYDRFNEYLLTLIFLFNIVKLVLNLCRKKKKTNVLAMHASLNNKKCFSQIALTVSLK